jgi:hypothetical protein
LRTDRERLVPKVIEFEDDRIRFAAVGAGMSAEVLDEILRPLDHQLVLLLSRSLDIPRAIRFVMLALVSGSTGTAEAVALPARLAPPSELGGRLRKPTAAAA